MSEGPVKKTNDQSTIQGLLRRRVGYSERVFRHPMGAVCPTLFFPENCPMVDYLLTFVDPLLSLLQAVDIVGGEEEEQGLPATQAQRHVRTVH